MSEGWGLYTLLITLAIKNLAVKRGSYRHHPSKSWFITYKPNTLMTTTTTAQETTAIPAITNINFVFMCILVNN